MERLAALAFILLIGITVYSASRPAEKLSDGSKPIPTETRYHAYRAANDPSVDGTVEVHDGPGNPIASLKLYAGRVYEAAPDPSASATASRITFTAHRDLYFIDAGTDFGTVAGAGPQDYGDGRIHVGLRYSPVRLAYGTLAPDFVITQDAAGAGISLYPPEGLFGPEWRHFGAGLWYGIPFRGGDPGFFGGLSFTVRN